MFRLRISLLKDLKIDINANRTYSENFSENFKVVNSQYNALNPNISGNFAISSVLIKKYL